MRTVRYRKAPRVLLSVLRERTLRSNAVLSVRAGRDPIGLHGLEIVGRARHVFQVRQRLQRFNDFAHHRSSFWVPTKAPSSQLCGFLGAFYGKMTLEPGIYQPVVFQASSGHEFINQKPLIIFDTVTNEFHQIRMNEVTKKIHFSLPNEPIKPTVSPVPGLTGAVPFSSIHPLNTQPKPPSPRSDSGLKFLVANFRSLNVNFRSREEILSSSSSLEVDELLSAMLVAVEEITGAAGWSTLVSFAHLLSVKTKLHNS
nr:hypothetical protein BHE74_00030866 [Ipomoea batatas]